MRRYDLSLDQIRIERILSFMCHDLLYGSCAGSQPLRLYHEPITCGGHRRYSGSVSGGALHYPEFRIEDA